MASPLPPTPEALHDLVSTIPAKTLHAYVLAHLPTAPPDTLSALASFFAALTLPPLLHCVRCNSDYVEIENDNRSCQVPHDESNYEIDWVGGHGDSEYETEFLCCRKTVKGEGDMGPPDGWCFEGKHTVCTARLLQLGSEQNADSMHALQTDVKLVRSRDDYDIYSLTCYDIPAPLPGPAPRAPPSVSRRHMAQARFILSGMGDDDDDDDDAGASRYTEDSSIGAMRQRGKVPRRTKAVARKSKPSAPVAASPHDSSSAPRGRKPRSVSKLAATDVEGKVRKRRKLAGGDAGAA